jgi:hypothetical protein
MVKKLTTQEELLVVLKRPIMSNSQRKSIITDRDLEKIVVRILKNPP